MYFCMFLVLYVLINSIIHYCAFAMHWLAFYQNNITALYCLSYHVLFRIVVLYFMQILWFLMFWSFFLLLLGTMSDKVYKRESWKVPDIYRINHWKTIFLRICLVFSVPYSPTFRNSGTMGEQFTNGKAARYPKFSVLSTGMPSFSPFSLLFFAVVSFSEKVRISLVSYCHLFVFLLNF